MNWQIQMFQNSLLEVFSNLGAPWGAPDGWMLNYTGLNGRV
jgi:hypothetical protein